MCLAALSYSQNPAVFRALSCTASRCLYIFNNQPRLPNCNRSKVLLTAIPQCSAHGGFKGFDRSCLVHQHPRLEPELALPGELRDESTDEDLPEQKLFDLVVVASLCSYYGHAGQSRASSPHLPVNPPTCPR